MLEGTDAKVHFIQYTPEMEEARSCGELRINSFVRLRRLSGAARLDVIDLGDAEKLLKNTRHLGETVRHHLKRGVTLTQDGWGGWLGRYQAVLGAAALEMETADKLLAARARDRHRDRSRGR